MWSNLNDSGPGSLRAAIAGANSGDTIQYIGPTGLTMNLDSTLELGKNLTIKAPNGGVSIVQDPNSQGPYFRLFDIDGTFTCELDNLWIGYGGGIVNGGNLTLSRCTVAGNQYASGAGIFNSGGDLTLANCAVTSNTATDMGGGIYSNGGSVTCGNSSITYNRAETGGGIALNSQTASLTLGSGASVSNNTATDIGGGIYDYMGTVTASDANIQSNTAANRGGGLYIDGNSANVTLTIVNVTSNTVTAAAGQGGGFFENNGSLTLNWVALSGNQAAAGPGGYWMQSNGAHLSINDPVGNQDAIAQG